jgi:hypothetical protein
MWWCASKLERNEMIRGLSCMEFRCGVFYFFLPITVTILTLCMCGGSGGGVEKMMCYMKLVFFQRNIHVFFYLNQSKL